LTDYIPIVDLFAGPGGLSEGFSSFSDDLLPQFKITLSVEKEKNAHATLELRSFFRQFKQHEVPNEYYYFLRQEISKDDLFCKYPSKAENARKEARQATLGETDRNLIDKWINEALKGESDEWVLIGGPPCQAYSLAGRSRNKGISGYKPEQDKRHFLYKEYLRIIAKHWPSVFVMENVKGLLSSRVDGHRVFESIFNDLSNPGKAVDCEAKHQYRIFSLVESSNSPMGITNKYTIECENYGIPQARHRVIILGVRDSCNLDNNKPEVLKPANEKVSVWDVISDLPSIRSGLSQRFKNTTWCSEISKAKESKWYKDLDSEFRMLIDKKIKEVNHSARFMPELGNMYADKDNLVSPMLSEWFTDERLKGVCNHITRNQMPGDLHRYLFASCFAFIHGKSPSLNDFPRDLLPDHKNVDESLKSRNLFNDRFRVQLPFKPSTTITSHIAKDGHYYIHPDPVQCRCLSVREVARLQTFPDNYYFCGSRTAQYTQVGNAVPPLLARKIARIVSSFLAKDRE